MMFIWIFFLAVLLLSTKAISTRQRSQVDKNQSLDILRNRYVRGEISREQFLHMQNTLNRSV